MWTSPVGFHMDSFTCRILAGKGRELLFSKSAGSLIPFNGSGHSGGRTLRGELVEIESPADLDRKDISGKIVLTRLLSPASLRTRLIEGRALGLISAFNPRQKDHPEFIKWENAWDSESDGWMLTAEGAMRNMPAACISPNDGETLHSILASGDDIVAEMAADGRIGEDMLPGAFARMRGSNPEDILLTAHLFEPGFIDNASGVALSLAASAALSEMRSGDGRGFLRGVRTFHSQECYGVLALADQRRDLLEGTYAHLDTDMVGTAGMPVNLHRGLGASTGFAPRILGMLLAKSLATEGIPLRDAQDFDINCTVLAEPALGGIPTSLIAQDNPGWHSSGDSPLHVKPDMRVLSAIGRAVTAWMNLLCTAGRAEFESIRNIIADESIRHAGNAPDSGVFLEIGKMEMKSLAVLLPPEERKEFVTSTDKSFADIEAKLSNRRQITPSGSDEEKMRAKELFPRTLIGGPAVNRMFSSDEIKALGSPRWSNAHLVLKSYADGSRSIYDIAKFAISELGGKESARLTLPYLIRFFDIYARGGVVEMSNKKRAE